MKKFISFAVAFSLMFMLFDFPTDISATDTPDSDSVAINETNFPDEQFRSFIKQKVDKNNDGFLSDAERGIANMYPSDFGFKKIKNFKGLEFFEKLTAFGYNYSEEPVAIDFSNNPLLQYINAYDGKITSVNVSGCKNLIQLLVENNYLSSLDVSQNTELELLTCHGNNLTSLDVTNNTKLKEFSCSETKLSTIDITMNTALEKLLIQDTPISSIDLSSNINLLVLDMENCMFETIDLSNNTKLEKIYFAGNKLTSIDFPNKDNLVVYTGGGNSYDISVGCDREFILSNLPGSFDVNKAYDWVGGKVSGTTLTIDENASEVTYKYKAVCKNVNYAPFKLVVNAAEHQIENVEITKPATCTTNGESKGTCKVCQKELTETIEATGHNYVTDSWEKDEKFHWHKCSGCGDMKDKAAHEWGKGVVTKNATCAEPGVEKFTCECGEEKTEAVPATGNHNWDEVTKDATCTAEGTITKTCSVCKKFITTQIPKTNHTEEIILAVPANCTETGLTEGKKCSVCGTILKDQTVIAELGHKWDGGTITLPATEENDGIRLYTCTACGFTREEVLSKLDHTHTPEIAWNFDNDSHWHNCSGCPERFDLASHSWDRDNGIVTVQPTEMSEGEMTYTCSDCKKTMTEPVPKLEHTHIFDTIWHNNSTSHWHECGCGEKSEETLHIPSDWIVETFPTTDSEGVKIKKCTVCNTELERVTIEKLANNGNVAEEVQDTAGTNSELVQDNTLIANTLTPEDITEIENGSHFDIVLEVTDIKDRVPEKDAEAAPTALKPNEKIGVYVDLSLFKIKDNNEADKTVIHETSGEIGITLTIPDSIYAADRTYSIIRVHDGNAENLGGTYDKASRKLTFYTDKFSTYAIAYTASNVETDNRPSIPSTPSKPSVPTTDDTTPVPPSEPAVTPTVTEITVKNEEEVLYDKPYVEDVSAGAGASDDSEDTTRNSKNYAVIIILVAASAVGFILRKKVSK